MKAFLIFITFFIHNALSDEFGKYNYVKNYRSYKDVLYPKKAIWSSSWKSKLKDSYQMPPMKPNPRPEFTAFPAIDPLHKSVDIPESPFFPMDHHFKQKIRIKKVLPEYDEALSRVRRSAHVSKPQTSDKKEGKPNPVAAAQPKAIAKSEVKQNVASKTGNTLSRSKNQAKLSRRGPVQRARKNVRGRTNQGPNRNRRNRNVRSKGQRPPVRHTGPVRKQKNNLRTRTQGARHGPKGKKLSLKGRKPAPKEKKPVPKGAKQTPKQQQKNQNNSKNPKKTTAITKKADSAPKSATGIPNKHPGTDPAKEKKVEKAAKKGTRRLIAARDADIEEYPYVVSIQKGDEHWCAGALLNQRLVVTTANCVWKSSTISRMRIRAGSRYTDHGGQKARIQEVMKHPNWSIRKNPDNDLALMLLDRNLKFSDSCHAVDLPNRMMSPPFDDAWVSSWGTERRDGVYNEQDVSRTLQIYHNKLLEHRKCSNITRRYGVAVTDNFICLTQDNHQAPCTRDTGAPAVSDGVLWGVASWGIRKLCGTERYPAMFSYLGSESNLDFIMNATHTLMSENREDPFPDHLPQNNNGVNVKWVQI